MTKTKYLSLSGVYAAMERLAKDASANLLVTDRKHSTTRIFSGITAAELTKMAADFTGRYEFYEIAEDGDDELSVESV